MSNPRYAKVVQLDDARRPTVTTRELVRILAHARAFMDQRPHRYVDRHHLDRSTVLTFEQFRRSPDRTSMFGHRL